MSSKNVPEQQKTFQSAQQYANSYEHKFCYYLVYSKNLSY